MTIDLLATIFGIVGTISAIIFAVLAFRRNNKADDTSFGKQTGEILTNIGYIKSGVDDIKRKQERQDEQHIEVVERLSAVESSTKQAHHRIDSLEKTINQ